jgi:hypothetical protein
MSLHEFNEESGKAEDASFDREIDAALHRLGTAEPRAGLEQRVLANLAAARKQNPGHGWWRWPAAAVAMVFVMAIAFTLRMPHHGPNVVEPLPPIAQSEISSIVKAPAKQATQRQVVRRTRRRPVQADVPRLAKFPSPQPMSEQEKILESYVANYPQHAALIAEARAEALRQDLAEEGAAAGKDSSRLQ